jgi:hypothetical protein
MTFRGWTAEALEFFDGLEAENTKAYWQRNKRVARGTVARNAQGQGQGREVLPELCPAHEVVEDQRRAEHKPTRSSLRPIVLRAYVNLGLESLAP